MKQRLKLFGLIGLFWMAFYTVTRILFLLYHFHLTSQLSFSDVFTILALGSRMDAAIAADSLVFTGLILTVSCFWNSNVPGIINHVVVTVLLTVAALVTVADLELYKHWGFRMDSTPLMYVGSEGASTVSLSVKLLLFALFLLLVIPFGYWYFRKIAGRFYELPSTRPVMSVVMLLVTGLLFIPIRSSFSVAPLNTGVVYFHKTNPFANHAGINVIWNFFESVLDDHQKTYDEGFFDKATALNMVDNMTRQNGQTVMLTTEARPNILLIVLESFTARIVEPLGGVPGVTPELNNLVKEGILFDNFYASGDRTDKGMVSILSGYPAQPQTSIIKYPSKTQNLPFLSRELAKVGYQTSFIYGGDIGFANMESYLTTAGFSHITEDDDFPSDLIETKWGVHDHHVFDRLLVECDSASRPFFKMMLSLSSHEPFDVPLDTPRFAGNSDRDLFLNSCYYTDKSLGRFIREAKTKPWWANTLVVITADHGHRFPDNEELKDKGRFQIPLLMLGGALSQKDSIVHRVGGQTDLARTIIAQVGGDPSPFSFGKNLMDADARPWAVYIFHGGYGLITDQAETVYDFDLKDYVKQTGPADQWDMGKAFMEKLFADYNSR